MLYIVSSSTGDSCPHPLTFARAQLVVAMMKISRPQNTYTISLILDI